MKITWPNLIFRSMVRLVCTRPLRICITCSHIKLLWHTLFLYKSPKITRFSNNLLPKNQLLNIFCQKFRFKGYNSMVINCIDSSGMIWVLNLLFPADYQFCKQIVIYVHFYRVRFSNLQNRPNVRKSHVIECNY